MVPVHAVIDVAELESTQRSLDGRAAPDIPALSDLDSLVAEVGTTYPLVAYTALDAEQTPAESLDSMILAGLVSP